MWILLYSFCGSCHLKDTILKIVIIIIIIIIINS